MHSSKIPFCFWRTWGLRNNKYLLFFWLPLLMHHIPETLKKKPSWYCTMVLLVVAFTAFDHSAVIRKIGTNHFDDAWNRQSFVRKLLSKLYFFRLASRCCSPHQKRIRWICRLICNLWVSCLTAASWPSKPYFPSRWIPPPDFWHWLEHV